MAACLWASKPRVPALQARTLGFEAHTENCCNKRVCMISMLSAL